MPPPLPPKRATNAKAGSPHIDPKQTSDGAPTSSLPTIQLLRTDGFHRQRLAIVAMAALGIVATFLPWIHAPIIGSVAGTAGDGWITLALFLPAACVSLLGNKAMPLLGLSRLAAAVPAAVAGIIGVWKFFDFRAGKAAMANDSPLAQALSVSVQIGGGIYLLVFAGAGLVFVAWHFARQNSQSR